MVDSPRIARERATIRAMLRLYCRRHHAPADASLCADCAGLLAYALRRIDVCPHGDAKPSCGACAIHCYDRANRERIRTVMRWAGPRMLLHHPWLSLMHWRDALRPGRAARSRIGV